MGMSMNRKNNRMVYFMAVKCPITVSGWLPLCRLFLLFNYFRQQSQSCSGIRTLRLRWSIPMSCAIWQMPP